MEAIAIRFLLLLGWKFSLGMRFGPLSLWDPFITPVFSASVNDGVIERLLALLGVKSQTFVEIGTV